MKDYIDESGKMYCGLHRREVCHQCCVDHRFCNEIICADGDLDMDALNARHDQLQETEHAAMVQMHRSEGGTGPVVLGSAESHRLFQAAASRPGQQACANCGMPGDRFRICERCQTNYCSQTCLEAHWPEHKKSCKAIAKAGGLPVVEGKDDLVGWKELEALQGGTADNKVLQLRVLSQPESSKRRYRFEGELFGIHYVIITAI